MPKTDTPLRKVIDMAVGRHGADPSTWFEQHEMPMIVHEASDE